MRDIDEVNEYMNMVKMDKSKTTVANYEATLKKFIDMMNINTFSDIQNLTTAQCRAFISELQKSGLKNSSINQHIRSLKVFFNFLVSEEKLKKSPLDKIKNLKTEKKLPEFLTEEETRKLISACKKPDDLIIFSLIITAGLRRNELVTLKVEDIIDEHIYVNGKGSKERVLPLKPEVAKILKEYMEYRNNKYGLSCPYLLVSKMGDKYTGEAIRQRIQTIGKRTNIDPERLEKIHPHLGRHTFAVNMVDSGIDMRVIQGAMGHSNVATTEIYAHLRNSTLDRAILNQKSIFEKE